jgi:hypothetical protein
MNFEIISRENSGSFRRLQGKCDLFAVILSFLSAKDLCILSQVSRHLLSDCTLPYLWKHALQSDFLDIEIENNAPTKLTYISHFNAYYQRVSLSIAEREQISAEARKDRITMLIQDALDLTQTRVMAVLPVFSLFLFILLISLKYDGRDISSWQCFSPILLFLVYLLLNVMVALVMYRYQFSQSSIFRGLWQQMSGPIKYFYNDIISQSLHAAYFSISILLLCILQVILIAAKLSDENFEMSETSLPWGAVFFPIWCFFVAYFLLPFICSFETSTLIFNFFLVWIPMFIFFVCLTVKLSEEDKNPAKKSIRLALIFIPFWLYESFIMLFAFFFLIYGIYKYRQGFDYYEYLGKDHAI